MDWILGGLSLNLDIELSLDLDIESSLGLCLELALEFGQVMDQNFIYQNDAICFI